MDELDEIHEASMRAAQRATLEKQNKLLLEYEALRAEMIRLGLAGEDDLPLFKLREIPKTVAH